jgi:cellulose 1,4-beta-cellobiosidase
MYVQNGKVIQNSKVNILGMETYDSITDAFCNDQVAVFNDTNSFETREDSNVWAKHLTRAWC